MRAAGVVVLAATILAVLAGCGSTNVDTGKIERQLQTHIVQESGLPPGQVKVDCPAEETAKAGRTFTCTLRYGGARRTVLIRLNSDDTYSATIQTGTTPTTSTE